MPKMHYFLSLASFQYFEIKPPIPYMGLHPPHPLLQFTPFKSNKFSLKTVQSCIILLNIP